jgi:putative ABC transport system substrate-binding protein
MVLNIIRKNKTLPLFCKAAIIFSIILAHSYSFGSEIVSVQSIDIKPYNDAYRGFKSICGCDAEQLVISEMQGMDVIREINYLEPDLIVSIGIRALNTVKEIKDIPIVYLMVLDPDPVISGNSNITGVNIYIPPEKQLFQIRNIIPHVTNIGLVYDPSINGNFVKKAISAAKAANIRLTAKEISNAKDFPALLDGMKDEIDVFWMLPDLTAFNSETTEYLFLSSIENNMPVITFSNKYLEMGALISFNIDAFDMGKQAYEVSDKILKGAKVSRMKKTFARKLNIEINQMTAKKFGIFNINNKLIKAVAINLE